MSRDYSKDTGELEVTSDLSKKLGLNREEVFGPYQLISNAHRRGLTEEFRAIDTRFDKPVTIILTSPEPPASSSLLHDEALALRELHHPGIRNIIDYHDDEISRPYLVTEWVEIEELNTIAKSGSFSSNADILSIIRDVADTLCYVHSRGFAHRDIKPMNILIDNSRGAPRSKLIGFELVIQVDKDVPSHTSFAGTPRYASPEQFRGSRIGFSSDVFSLGLVLYETMFDGRPYMSTPLGYIESARKERANLMADLKSGKRETFKGLKALVYGMLSEDPALRPTMTEVKAQLDQILASRAGRSVAVEPTAEKPSTAIGVIMACGYWRWPVPTRFRADSPVAKDFCWGASSASYS